MEGMTLHLQSSSEPGWAGILQLLSHGLGHPKGGRRWKGEMMCPLPPSAAGERPLGGLLGLAGSQPVVRNCGRGPDAP